MGNLEQGQGICLSFLICPLQLGQLCLTYEVLLAGLDRCILGAVNGQEQTPGAA